MKIVVFGLSISSAWGNGHATLLRGLFRALHLEGHQVAFFERDVPYYAAHRDAEWFPFVDLHLYSTWKEVSAAAAEHLKNCDAAMVTSYCPDAVAATQLITEMGVERAIFYDMDTPVTLHRLEQGEPVEYVPPKGLGDFDLVLSYTGGEALHQLKTRLKARRTAPLYGWVDPQVHHAAEVDPALEADLSYLGTYAPDRQPTLDELLITPARLLPQRRFLLAGAMYPELEQKPANLRQLDHLAPSQHSAFFSSSRLTLNVTRASMAAMGYCPSGRLFEATACGTPVLSDWWRGLDEFFKPGEEILIAKSAAEACEAIVQDAGFLRQMSARARERTFDCHTAAIRARQFVELVEAPVNAEAPADRVVYGSAVYEGAT